MLKSISELKFLLIYKFHKSFLLQQFVLYSIAIVVVHVYRIYYSAESDCSLSLFTDYTTLVHQCLAS